VPREHKYSHLKLHVLGEVIIIIIIIIIIVPNKQLELELELVTRHR
jgi:hypothetical protein